MRLPSSFDLLPAAFPFMGSLAFNDNYGAEGGWGGGGSAYTKNLQHSPTYGRFCAYEEKGVATYLSAGYVLSEAHISSTQAKMFCLEWTVRY